MLCEPSDEVMFSADLDVFRSKIPKPNEEQGLVVGWPQQKLEMDELKALAEQIKSKM